MSAVVSWWRLDFHVRSVHGYNPPPGLDVNKLRQLHDRLHDWPRGGMDQHRHPVCTAPGCTGVMMQLRPAGFYICDESPMHVRHIRLCVDDEGRLVCVCGADAFLTSIQPGSTDLTNPKEQRPVTEQDTPTPPPGFTMTDSAFASSEGLNPDLCAAFVKAFGAISNVSADASAEIQHKNGKKHSYSYMTLGGILQAVRQPLSENGLALMQAPAIDRRGANVDVSVTTRLLHETGQFMEATVSMSVDGRADAQAIGSAMTYARRYGVTALLAIASGDDDDDGAAASRQSPQSSGEYNEPAPKNLDKAAATARVLEAFEGDRVLANLFWKELMGKNPGPFAGASIEASIKLIPDWRRMRAEEGSGQEVPVDPPNADESGENEAVAGDSEADALPTPNTMKRDQCIAELEAAGEPINGALAELRQRVYAVRAKAQVDHGIEVGPDAMAEAVEFVEQLAELDEDVRDGDGQEGGE